MSEAPQTPQTPSSTSGSASTPPPTDPRPKQAQPGRLATARRALRKIFGTDEQLTVEQQIKRRTLLSFSVFAVLGAAAWKSWFLLKDQPHDNGIPKLLRKGLDADKDVFINTLSPNHLVPTYPKSVAATHTRRNGDAGMNPNGFDPQTWKLQVTTTDSKILSFGIDELRQLPKTEFAFEFKCIEGWSQISHWGGVKFSDFIKKYNLEKEAALKYVGLNTPDKEYYVGIDMPSALHPQTLLCYEMNGQPLPIVHGGPLRLIIPVKYGVKNLKRISNMFFSDERPPDYWFERGYDYYCGL
jgi:DMSO/TMAO reductase YedYZ molybdopterin-dependent catalytic subunit